MMGGPMMGAYGMAPRPMVAPTGYGMMPAHPGYGMMPGPAPTAYGMMPAPGGTAMPRPMMAGPPMYGNGAGYNSAGHR
jgi:hypothetical protein